MNNKFERSANSVFDNTLLAGGPTHDALSRRFVPASVFPGNKVDKIQKKSPAMHFLSRGLTMMRQVIHEGRHVLQGIRSNHPPSTNLEKAFAAFLNDFGPTYTSRIRVVVVGLPRPLKPDIQEQIYLIGREATLNALHHSGATSVEVEVEYFPRRISLVVRDNGCGIEQKRLKSRRDMHCGFLGLMERAQEIGAKLQIWSKPRAGTELKLSLPISPEFECGI